MLVDFHLFFFNSHAFFALSALQFVRNKKKVLTSTIIHSEGLEPASLALAGTRFTYYTIGDACAYWKHVPGDLLIQLSQLS